MDLTNVKSELDDFINKLYNDLKETLKECTNVKEVSEILEEEYNNLNDYKKVVKFNTISKIKEELMGKIQAGDAIKKALEIESKIGEIDIVPIEIDQNKIYLNEDKKPIIEKKETGEKKSIKTIIVILAIITGAAFGWVVKRNVLDVIVMGFIGALIGYAVYEISLGEDNKNIERVIKNDRLINKRIDMNYLSTLIHERKCQVENVFLNYINEFNNISKKLEN